MSPIKLVGFDLDDCLFDSTGLSERARIKGIDAMIKLGLKIDRDKAIKMIKEIVKEYGSNSSKHYNYFIRRYNRLENISESLSYSDQFKFISAAVMAYHSEKINSIKVYNDVIPTLNKIRKMDIKTAIISDGIPIKQYEKILRLGIDDLIDMTVISDEIGIRKPNPKLFEHCLKKFEVIGRDTIYIGDRIEKDIIPAQLCDIHSILIRRGGKYDPSIRGYGEIKPNHEIFSLSEIFEIIDEINAKESN
ncbi:MAG: TIGR02253 family HAD-type hydrolase [Candidatus Lokiarchaeota archaeon]|nr:TIGR02253 family HAD-type hydrolase [Candidatus Lokiarchaeota archaeon]